MVYRSDTEALAARLEVLEKDLAERTRERDDVAKLLADAKATDEAQQWLADAPRPPRRRWMIAGLSLMLAGVAGFATYQSTHPQPDRFEQTLKAFAQYTNEICACVDKTCAQAVTDQLTKWGQEMAMKDRELPKPSEDQLKQITEVTKRFSDCLIRAMQDDPSQGPQNQLAK